MRIPPVTRHLLIVTVAIWLVTSLFGLRGADVTRYLGLHYFTSPDFNPAQLLTYMFLHDTPGFTHILFNMFSLYMFGRILEQVMGSKRFLFYYLSTGIGAGLVQLGVIALQLQSLGQMLSPEMLSEVYANGADAIHQGMNYTNPYMAEYNGMLNGVAIGASGAVFGILLAFGMLFPNMPLYLFFIPVPIKAKWMVLGYGLLELWFGVTGTMQGVAHFAHLGGLLVGLVIMLIWKKKGIVGGGYYF